MSLLFIILGWTEKAMAHSACYSGTCRNCDNVVWYYPVKTRRWFAALGYFIFPMGLNDYFLFCDVCQTPYEIDKGRFKFAKSLIKYTSRYLNKEISVEEYEAIVSKKIAESEYGDDMEDVNVDDVPEETPPKSGNRGFH